MSHDDLEPGVIIKLRRDSTINWATDNPVLAVGETGWDTDLLKVKLGDGVTAWNDLPYAIDGPEGEVDTVAGVAPVGGDVPAANLKTALNLPTDTATDLGGLDTRLDAVELYESTFGDIVTHDASEFTTDAEFVDVDDRLTSVEYGRILRHVAGRGLISDTRSNGTDTSATCRVRFPLEKAVTAVRLVYANFYVPSGSGETTNAATLTVKASVEDTTLVSGRIAGTTLVPVFFNGKRTTTLEGGGVLVSDPVYINTPDDWALFVRTYVSVTLGDRWPTPYATSSSASIQTDGSGVSEGQTIGSDLTDSGAMTGGSAFVFGPTAVIAATAATAEQTHGVAVISDSLGKGTGIVNPVGSYQVQPAYNAGLPTMRLACGGESFTFIKSQANLWRRMQVVNYAHHVLCGYGINDITTGSSLATLKADAITCWQIWQRLGLSVHQHTVLPHPGASTDAYLTASGQSIANAGQEAVRTGFNSWLRDPSGSGAVAQSNGALTSVIDGAALIEVNASDVLTLNGGFWKAGGPVSETNTATSATTTTLTRAGAGWTTNQFQNQVVLITSATTGAGQFARITSNTATVLSINPAWTTPTGTIQYQIHPAYCYDHLHMTEPGHILITAGLDLSYLLDD